MELKEISTIHISLRVLYVITFPHPNSGSCCSRSRILRILTADILDVRQLISFEHLTEKFNLLTNHFYVYCPTDSAFRLCTVGSNIRMPLRQFFAAKVLFVNAHIDCFTSSYK